MCNLYSLTKGQAAIRDWFRTSNDRTGNLPLFPRIFPDQMAPIVRNGADGERELVMARWGMPGPPQFGGAPITNIRNVASPHWRGWLGKHNRCIVPATSFCEYADTKPRKTPKWFALSQDRPLFAFAGLCERPDRPRLPDMPPDISPLIPLRAFAERAREIVRTKDEFEASWQAAGEHPDVLEAAARREALSERWSELAMRVATTPAKTMEGLIAKIALIASGYAEDDLDGTYDGILASAALDARALANARETRS